MRRRSDAPLDAQALFAELCQFQLDWPEKTVRLERNSLLDHQQRPTSPNVSVAELYHENSKLYPNMLGELAAARVKVKELRQEFIRRRAAVAARHPPEQGFDHHAVRQLLTAVAQTMDHELFYALELRVAAGNLLATHEPSTDSLQVVKHLSPEDLEKLRSALRLTISADALPEADIAFDRLFAKRASLLSRGYRRTLLEAGQVTAGLLAGRAPWSRCCPIFNSRIATRTVEADGIEEGTRCARHRRPTMSGRDDLLQLMRTLSEYGVQLMGLVGEQSRKPLLGNRHRPL
jgi:hypothetical protein